jgi:rod shape-determining protein MreD
MTKNIVWTTVFCVFGTILQSTLFLRLSPFHAVPDLALLVLVYSSYMNGALTGETSGFFAGLLQDFLSAAPLGLNMFVRTIIGAAAGVIKGTFIMDAVLLPALLTAGATLLKAVLLSLLHLLFGGAAPAYVWTKPVLWMELGMNVVLSPLLFLFLRKVRSLIGPPDESEKKQAD